MPSNPSSPVCRPTAKAYPKRPKNKLRVRQYPPIDSCAGNVGKWIWKNNSSVYRKRIAKAVRLVQTYRLKTTGSTHLDRTDKDAIHSLLDPMTFDSSRRDRDSSRQTKSDGGVKDILTDSLKY